MATLNDQLRRRQLILDRLHLAQRTQGWAARKAKVSRSMVCHVIAGRKKHVGVQHILALVCNMTYHELWED
ncbi:MAG: hypothetical protein HN849_08025 [Victivallales bacterium]|jgi:hypothetical protein|nr:hypothetical protein [Victivallales bacterium]MBT7163470.1 hypothetical protein [Victivallales bacterium]MBT7299443.1 hypothetical protein [Victivallales bacterium]